MKLQQTTWILVSIALILGGFVYFSEIQGQANQEAIAAKEKQVLNIQEKNIKKITIEKKEQTIELEKTKNNLSPWQMKKPENTPASDASVSFLVDLLVKGKSDRAFTTSSNQLQEYGLDRPIARVKIELQDRKNHELILGKPNLNDKFIYAQVDPDKQKQQELEVILVPKNFQYAVERELSEWKQP